MIRSVTLMLGAGLLAAVMSAPLAVRAHAEANTLAFVIGAAAAHARHDNERTHIRHPHRRDVVPVHRSWHRDRHGRTHHRRHEQWYARHRDRYDRLDRYDRRWDRYDRRWDRHDRRHDRRDRHYDRKYRRHGRDDHRGRRYH